MNFLRMEEVDADYEEKEFEEIDLMEFDCGMVNLLSHHHFDHQNLT